MDILTATQRIELVETYHEALHNMIDACEQLSKTQLIIIRAMEKEEKQEDEPLTVELLMKEALQVTNELIDALQKTNGKASNGSRQFAVVALAESIATIAHRELTLNI